MQEHTDKPIFYSTSSICRMLNVSRQWLWEQVNAGLFPKPIKFGRLNRYRAEEIDAYIAEKTSA